MGTQADIVRGRDLVARVQFAGKPWSILVREMAVEEVGELFDDHVNGEDQSRPEAVIHGYLATCQCYDDGNADILKNFIAYRQNIWTKPQKGQSYGELPLLVGIRFNWRKFGQAAGSRASDAFVFGGVMALAPLRMSAVRKEAISHTVAFRSQTFTTTRSA